MSEGRARQTEGQSPGISFDFSVLSTNRKEENHGKNGEKKGKKERARERERGSRMRSRVPKKSSLVFWCCTI